MRKKDFSEVQRYTNDYCGSVSLDVNGEYVKYEDYERLLRAYNELEEELADCGEWCRVLEFLQ